MTTRRLADLTDLALDLDDLPADEVLDGSPRAGARTLAALGGVEVGVWEMTAGTARDVEVDEVFVLLSGSGTVEFEDGESIDLRPGTLVRLRAGDRTVWTVRKTLRKVWVA